MARQQPSEFTFAEKAKEYGLNIRVSTLKLYFLIMMVLKTSMCF